MAPRRSSEGPRAQRLFVAVAIPPAAAGPIDRAIGPWRERLPGVRWVAPASFHLTVRFLGDVVADDVTWVRDRLEGVVAAHPPFAIGPDRLGAFPERGRARVLYAGVRGDVRALEAVADAVRSATAPRIPRDGRTFRAHVTVGRAGEPVRVPAAYRDTVIGGRPFRVEALELMRSHLAAGAPRYERVASFPLTG